MEVRQGKILKFFRLSGREKSLFCEAILLQFWVGLLLKVIPFSRIPALFASQKFKSPTIAGDQSRQDVWERKSDGLELPSARMQNIRMAIQRASKISPWKNRCLVSSLAARLMLRWRRIDSKLFLGVTKERGGKMTAHAWLTVDGEEIVPRSGDYLTMYEF